jgi:hypothetical protein
VAALTGGVGWLVKVALIWANGGENTDSGLVGVMYLVGLVGLVVALGAAGYTLAEKAPVWLRAVVVVATPLLVMVVWVLLDQAVRAVYTTEGWFRDEVTVLLTAVVALLLGGWGLRRGRAAAEPAPTSGRRTAS